jgi:excinuclease ABC subunit A
VHNHVNKNSEKMIVGEHDKVEGVGHIDKVVNVSQDPIGRTPRSNAATYTGVFDLIRDLFSQTNESKIRGYTSGRFSFNVDGGRCDKCKGDGIIKIPMHFLPDVNVVCDECDGKRYNEETLQIKYKDKNIFDILNMSVDEAFEFFENNPKIRDRISYLKDVGMGYISLGHPATLLSGGEAQRIKLATYLQKKPTGKALYILDEPTTGLHFNDVKRLLTVLQRIVDGGDTLIVIEHNIDVIKCADIIVDIGPDGGDKGGMVMAKGTPEMVASSKNSYLAPYLKEALRKARNK